MTPSDAEQVRAAVRSALDARPLVWFGIRGEDAVALRELPELRASYAITAPLEGAAGIVDVTYEQIAGERPDLDRFDLDLDEGPAADAFREAINDGTTDRCVVMTYRPSEHISELAFRRRATLTVAGPTKARQQVFEHKPWVETTLADRGVRTLDWRYVIKGEDEPVRRMLAEGPVVLRQSRTSGGVGIVRVDADDDLEVSWPAAPGVVIGATPFVPDALPVNVSGCVFRDGTVRVHPPSVQLVGIPSCIDRPFGYCGNDLAAARAMSYGACAALNALVRNVGCWLFEERYLGVFGIDALVSGDAVTFVEMNARFQGSSTVSATAAAELGVAGLFADHLAACLGVLPPSSGVTIAEWVAAQPILAHVVVHHLGSAPVVPRRDVVDVGAEVRVERVPPDGVAAMPGSVVARLVFGRQITHTGSALDPAIDRTVQHVRTSLNAV